MAPRFSLAFLLSFFASHSTDKEKGIAHSQDKLPLEASIQYPEYQLTQNNVKYGTVCGPWSVRSLVRDFFEYDLIFP